jgi:hypothetical protein
MSLMPTRNTGRPTAGFCVGLALLVAACTSSPAATPSPVATDLKPTTSLPAATGTARDSALPTDVPGASPSPAGCPSLPTDLATVRDLARAKGAIACFGSDDLTFRAYVPTTDSLGGVPESKMTPSWIADPWTGVIVQPMELAETDQSAWFVVRVAPALGKCQITDVQASGCPFGQYLDAYVSLTGHFDDATASRCKSEAFAGGTDPGPSTAKMVARCQREFVVTQLGPG